MVASSTCFFPPPQRSPCCSSAPFFSLLLSYFSSLLPFCLFLQFFFFVFRGFLAELAEPLPHLRVFLCNSVPDCFPFGPGVVGLSFRPPLGEFFPLPASPVDVFCSTVVGTTFFREDVQIGDESSPYTSFFFLLTPFAKATLSHCDFFHRTTVATFLIVRVPVQKPPQAFALFGASWGMWGAMPPPSHLPPL